jgi:hypothetical protein
MATNISISQSRESDLQEMITICCEAMEQDILTRFLYDNQRAEAIRKQTESLTVSLGNRFTHPTNRCYIIKAVEKHTGELVGWSLLGWEDGKPIALQEGSSDQLSFLIHYQQEAKRNWAKLIAEKADVGKILALPPGYYI